MKTYPPAWWRVLTLALFLTTFPLLAQTNQPAPIPLDQLGAVAGKQYQGGGLSVTATTEGARLHCAFQKLQARATHKGLWLQSTTPGAPDNLRLTATTLRRHETCELSTFNFQPSTCLPSSGTVSIHANLVRFLRPGLTEEYSVTPDGLRQDFIIPQPPPGAGDLLLTLSLTGARAEPAPYGAKLTLEHSGRTLAYSRLHAADATGQDLPAQLHVLTSNHLAITLPDAHATYPIRIDPTFSDADWVSLNPGGIPGANNPVNAIAVDDSGNIYVGGSFNFIGTNSFNRIAKWDGNSWSPLGSGIAGISYYVNALAMIGTNLYVGGNFTTAGGVTVNRIAKWDGTAWSALGSGVDGVLPCVYALAVSGDNLYVAGSFTTAGGVAANNIAKWDGTAWSALGSGLQGSGPYYVFSLAVSGTNLYAGGTFSWAGGLRANSIAKWDGSAWSPLGSGMDPYYRGVKALAVDGNNLYAGGSFTNAGGVIVNNIAKWDGSAWSALDSGMNGDVRSLAVIGTNLYAGGSFNSASGVSVNNIAKWDGGGWSALGSGLLGGYLPYVGVLVVSGTDLYAGGDFATAGEVGASRIAKWDGSAWSGFGSGMNHRVYALAWSGTDLYVGGNFNSAGDIVANYIAKWDGSTWSPLGSGMNDAVWALAVNGSNLYAGGYFTNAGGVPASHIAKWDGTAWSGLGSGINRTVYALAVSGTNLYAGGLFTNAGGIFVNNIAQWNGTAWSALGSGLTDSPSNTYRVVFVLAVSGSNLYAGGRFTNAGGVLANNIAKWDGNAWTPLGSGISGVNSTVSALAVSGDYLYVGGSFTTAGGVLANRIARWDGATWSALGSGLKNQVVSLAVNGDDVYAGGTFFAEGSLAKWDGTSWSPMGSGLTGGLGTIGPYPYALATDGLGHLFVGGNFYYAGTIFSPFIARANIGMPFYHGRFVNPTYSPLTGFTTTFRDATAGQPYRIQTRPSFSTNTWTDLTNFTYTAPLTITTPPSLNPTSAFYRAISP